MSHFEQLPNFFFEDLGETRLFHEDWKLVSYVNLEENLLIERNLEIAVGKLSWSCIQVNDSACQTNALVLNKKLARITKDRKRLYSSLGYRHNNRQKRGVFDFVGEVSKILFGTMSASDAEYYNSEIDKVYADNKRLTTIISNQTQILKLTIQNTENLVKDMKLKIIEFDNIITILNKNLNRVEFVLENNRKLIELIEIAEYFEICLTEYSHAVETLTNSVLAALSGQINPQLLEPNDLKTSLEHMSSILGISRMPLPVDETHFFEYLRISEISVVVVGNKLIFEIRLPLVEEDSYDTYRIIPLPREIKKHIFQYITVPHDYVFVDKHHLVYTPTDHVFLQDCKRVKSNRICKRQHPKYYVVAQDPCLNVVMNSPYKEQNAYCRYALINITRTSWIQLLDNHRWIFMASVTETIHIKCKNESREFLIAQVGLLTLGPGCLAMTPDTTLHSDQTRDVLPARHYESPFSYKFNTSRFNNPTFKLDLIQIPRLSQIHTNPSILRTAGKQLDELTQEVENISNHERTMTALEKTWFWLKYVGWGLFGFIIFYVSLKFRIIQALARWFVTKPCTIMFNNCFNSGGRNSCNQETVSREVCCHNQSSQELIMTRIPSTISKRKEKPRKHTSPVLDDLM